MTPMGRVKIPILHPKITVLIVKGGFSFKTALP